MNVVDSSGWIEFMTSGPNASVFMEPIQDLENLVVPTVSILEVFKWVLGHRDETAALQVAAAMRQGTVVDLDGELALLAAKLSLEHDLPLADSVIYATAQTSEATTWTQDADLEGLAEVRFVEKK
ncbi:MAG: type II toxin-antitoxin system VapC family toxin [Halobacteriales archaeon]|nr:type II toxin-antitoxin system VapC family toxin [Halobacteriales archaeon]